MSIEINTEDKLKELVYLTKLFDLYGPLLNEHTRSIFEDYVLNDLTLSEIADETSLTRQGVRDIVVRGSKKLYEFEEKLGFLAKTEETVAALDELYQIISDEDFNDNSNKIRALVLIDNAAGVFGGR